MTEKGETGTALTQEHLDRAIELLNQPQVLTLIPLPDKLWDFVKGELGFTEEKMAKVFIKFHFITYSEVFNKESRGE